MSESIPLILVAEDEPDIASLLEVMLRREGFHVMLARTGLDACNLARSHGPDVILLDLDLPGVHGTTVCKDLREDPATEDVPIIIVTALADKKAVAAGLDLGAVDYVTKPFDPRELIARVRSALRIKQRFDAVRARSAALAEMAFVDELTGLYNRRRMLERLQEEYNRAKRYQYPISCIFIDIDHFKAVNDTHGHAAGDEVLREVSSLVRGCIRAYDVPCRYGGEEIVVLLPQADAEQALIAAERIRSAVEGMTRDFGKISVTVSVGISSYPDTAQDAQGILEGADRAMYLAKEGGRNKVCTQPAIPLEAVGPDEVGGEAVVPGDAPVDLTALGERA